MIEEWKPIDSFPDYSVSNFGRIRSDRFDRIMALNQNQSGLVQVGMVRDGKQHHRSVPLLVAKAFMPRHTEPYDTPINLDGNRFNNRVDNLRWRPRWFALQYHRQFVFQSLNTLDIRIIDLKTEEIFDDSFECARRFGLLENDIINGIRNGLPVWPTHQEFAIYTE
jgi:hypothetical protein